MAKDPYKHPKTQIQYEGGRPIFQNIDGTKLKVPERLYKNYAINKYSIDALIGSYIYATKAEDLNDVYDCSPTLLDSQCLANIINNLGTYQSTESVNNKRIYKNRPCNILEDYISKKYGVISFSATFKTNLMWSHYVANSGFCLTFLTNQLSVSGWGPYPIQYYDEVFLYTDNQSFPLVPCFQKHKRWKYENEWRILAKIENENRKCKYSIAAIDAIHLGYSFFNRRKSSNNTFCFKHADDDIDIVLRKFALLSFLKNNPQIKVYVYPLLNATKALKFTLYKIEEINLTDFSVQLSH